MVWALIFAEEEVLVSWDALVPIVVMAGFAVLFVFVLPRLKGGT